MFVHPGSEHLGLPFVDTDRSISECASSELIDISSAVRSTIDEQKLKVSTDKSSLEFEVSNLVDDEDDDEDTPPLKLLLVVLLLRRLAIVIRALLPISLLTRIPPSTYDMFNKVEDC